MHEYSPPIGKRRVAKDPHKRRIAKKRPKFSSTRISGIAKRDPYKRRIGLAPLSSLYQWIRLQGIRKFACCTRAAYRHIGLKKPIPICQRPIPIPISYIPICHLYPYIPICHPWTRPIRHLYVFGSPYEFCHQRNRLMNYWANFSTDTIKWPMPFNLTSKMKFYSWEIHCQAYSGQKNKKLPETLNILSNMKKSATFCHISMVSAWKWLEFFGVFLAKSGCCRTTKDIGDT